MRRAVPWLIGTLGLGFMIWGIVHAFTKNLRNEDFLFALTAFVLGIPMILFAFSDARRLSQ